MAGACGSGGVGVAGMAGVVDMFGAAGGIGGVGMVALGAAGAGSNGACGTPPTTGGAGILPPLACTTVNENKINCHGCTIILVDAPNEELAGRHWPQSTIRRG